MDFIEENKSEIKEANISILAGQVVGPLCFSHRTYGENFYTFMLGICRNSGYEDKIIVMASERIMADIEVEQGEFLKMIGQIRTYNEEIEGRNRLNIVVFPKEIQEGKEGEYCNEICLEGFLCKKPIQRTSPLGRRICDMMLAVNRMYNKSDYIPCIAWGRNAMYANTLSVGDKISIIGRLQSREYRKRFENGDTVIKTAYEVSVLQLEKLS